jgi:hypothetical protein
MEQGASLKLEGDVLTVTPRSDIYVRYLGDNRNVIAELASELYGRRIRAEMASIGQAEKVAIPPVEASAGSAVNLTIVRDAPPYTAGSQVAAVNNGEEAPLAPGTSPPKQSQADARQRLYSDPIVQRIFREFEARLVDLKTISNQPDGAAPSSSKK